MVWGSFAVTVARPYVYIPFSPLTGLLGWLLLSVLGVKLISKASSSHNQRPVTTEHWFLPAPDHTRKIQSVRGFPPAAAPAICPDGPARLELAASSEWLWWPVWSVFSLEFSSTVAFFSVPVRILHARIFSPGVAGWSQHRNIWPW